MIFKLISIFGCAILSAAVDVSQIKTDVHFTAIGRPAAIKIQGELKNEQSVTGTLDFSENKIKGNIQVQLNHFDTGISLRNQHMKEKYLQTKEFPTAKLTLKETPISASQFSGTLELHGVQKEITGPLEVKDINGKKKGKLEFQVELSDFGIAVPSYLGITVSKEVKIVANFEE